MIILSEKAKRLLKLTGKVIAGLTFAFIFFMAGIMFEVMRENPNPKVITNQDIKVKELAYEVRKGNQFSLNVDEETRLTFKPSKNKWEIYKQRR